MKKILTLALCVVMVAALIIPVAASTNMTAPKATVTLDGERDDTYGGPWELKSMQEDAASTTGATGKVWIAWDNDYLYYYLEVADTTPNHNHNDDYGRDCVEMFIDWYNAKDEDTSNTAHPYWQYRIASAPNDAGQQFTNGINQAAGEDGTGWTLQEHVDSVEANSVVKLVDGGYKFETRIPYKKYNIDVKEGSVIAVDFMVGDNQEDDGRTSCAWLDPAFTSNNQWQYPNECGGLLTLGAAAVAPVVETKDEPAVETPEAVQESTPAPAPATAPQTGDMTILFCLIAILGAGVVSFRIIKTKA